jgi:hypothetical protein
MDHVISGRLREDEEIVAACPGQCVVVRQCKDRRIRRIGSDIVRDRCS